MTQIQTQTQIIKTDRSRIESYERCPALRFWSYEFKPDGAVVGGVQFDKPIWPLITGGAVHKGLETLLTEAKSFEAQGLGIINSYYGYRDNSNTIVAEALNEFLSLLGNYTPPTPTLQAQEEDELDLFGAANSSGESKYREADEPYQLEESRALVEALVRVYAMVPSGLEWLLANYEVLAVEEEIEWSMGAALGITTMGTIENPVAGETDIIVMSRPDGVLRSKSDGGLYVLSFKTAKEIDSRTMNQLRYDNQGIAELLAVEAKYGERVRGIQMVYLLKGPNRQDSDGVYRSSSPLIRPYCSPGMSLDDYDYAPSYNYTDLDGKARRIGKAFKRVNIWAPGQIGIERWLKKLMEDFPKVVEEQVVNLPVFFRNEGDVRRWLVSNFEREKTVAYYSGNMRGYVATNVPARMTVQGIQDQLDMSFPMNRKSCTYPSLCPMIPVCHQGLGQMLLAGHGPLEIGMVGRKANHPGEEEQNATDSLTS